MSRIEKIIEMLSIGGKDSFLQHALALEYIKLGKDGEALAQFNDLLEREPDYVGSYYHKAKLLEKNGKIDEALDTYEKGMEVAKRLNDKHSYNELMMAKEELE